MEMPWTDVVMIGLAGALVTVGLLVLVRTLIAHIVAGNVDFGLVGAILIGSIPGVWVGSHLTVKMPAGVVRVALGSVMIASAQALLGKAGISLPLAVIVAIFAALVAAVIARLLLDRRNGVTVPAS